MMEVPYVCRSCKQGGDLDGYVARQSHLEAVGMAEKNASRVVGRGMTKEIVSGVVGRDVAEEIVFVCVGV